MSPKLRRKRGERTLPFWAFIGFVHDDNVRIVVLGLAIVCSVFIAGLSRDEKRQYAVNAWHTPAQDVYSLGLCSQRRANASVILPPSDIRYRGHVAELNHNSFARVQLLFPEALYGRTEQDTPVLLAMSARVAEETMEGMDLFVLPPRGLQALRITTPKHSWNQLTEMHMDSDSDDVENADGDDQKSWSRYPWPCPLHVVRLSSHLRSLDGIKEVLCESAAIMSGSEQGFLESERLDNSAPADRTVVAWQIKMDFMAMLSDREVLATSGDHLDLHLGSDQSPQAGYQFMCTREEEFRMSPKQFEDGT